MQIQSLNINLYKEFTLLFIGSVGFWGFGVLGFWVIGLRVGLGVGLGVELGAGLGLGLGLGPVVWV